MGQDPRVTGGDLLGAVCPRTAFEVSGMAHDSSSCSCAVMLEAVSLGCSVVGCLVEGGIEALRETRVMGISSLGFMLERFTCNSDGSHIGLPGLAMFQTGDSGKVSHMDSNPKFRPPGHTLPDLHIARVCILLVG